MTMLADPAHNRQLRRARAVYCTLRAPRSASTDKSGSLRAELAMLAVFLCVAAGVIALRAWLHLPQL
ncbi:hypothetical protein [Bosea sp. 124]|uniref:hypothetical protein n=1 Tax=Bosea sp. 124 TaxID=2135642 RepID=UPI000D493C7C|nr:hypothetical protein [Bosea sp. 124]PTM42040.1 hypothetical protein C8D03_3618 [Bosea sp. 124]